MAQHSQEQDSIAPLKWGSGITRRQLLKGGAAVAASTVLPTHVITALADTAVATRNVKQASAATASVGSQPVQTMRGFGASGSWWPNDLVNFPSSVQNQVASMLFSASGINLSAYRYCIGGGGVGVTNPVRATQTFLVSPGTYDWTRDPGGRLFLSLAASNAVPVLLGDADSAPTYWTTNGYNCGGNLTPGDESAYAGYLADIAAHFQSVGTPLSYVSPMNEPDYTFGGSGPNGSGGSQEGMAVPPAQRAVLVQALAQQLGTRSLTTQVTADESSRVSDQFLPELAQWMGVAGTPQAVGVLVHHIYDFPSNYTLQQAANAAASYGKTLWCTEICCFVTQTGTFGRQYDPTIANAVVMANLIWQCLTYANDAAFHWWVACSSAIGADPSTDPAVATEVNSNGWNDGLLYYDPNYASNGNYGIYATKRYYALGNFSRYVRPGDKRYNLSNVPSNLNMLAFSNTGGWTLIVINYASAGSNPISFRVQMPTLVHPTGAFQTSGVNSLGSVALPGVNSRGVVSASVPAQSITTFTFVNG